MAGFCYCDVVARRYNRWLPRSYKAKPRSRRRTNMSTSSDSPADSTNPPFQARGAGHLVGVQAQPIQVALKSNERWLATVIANLPGMAYCCRIDRNRTMEFVSEGVSALTGFTPDDFMSGRVHWSQIQHPDDVDWFWEAQEAAREQRAFRAEYRIRHKDGSERWVLEHGQAVFDGDAEPTSFEGFVTDITERKRAEEALNERQAWLAGQREALEAALNGAPLEQSLGALVATATDRLGPGVRTAFYLADPERTALHHVVGMPADYAVAVDGFKIGPESLACGLATHTGQPVITCDVVTEPLWAPWLWMAEKFGYRGCWSFPVHTEAGKFVGTFAVYWPQPRETTALDRELAALLTQTAAIIISRHTDLEVRRQAEKALREADRRKDEFLAILAHELRNPLAPIRTGLELLRLGADKPGTLERIRPTLERQVAHMVRLIDDLLDVSRISSGKIQLKRQPSPLPELVRNAIDANRAVIEAGGLQLSVVLPDTPCVLDVDPTRFVQVLSNLLQNATKFTERGGHVAVAAHLEASASAPLLKLTVSDTGTGIAAETLPRVFDLFAQGDDSRTGKSGLGIGLALARQLVELHGGRIEAHSDGPGLGSSFTIHMPVLTLNDVDASSDLAAARAESITRKVLIIDDNVDAAETLAAFVRARGGEADVAHGGEDGLRVAASFQPEVILLDIGMPGIDGYETCRRLRGGLVSDATSIVALTGWGQEQARTQALGCGFDAHLIKPADPRALETLLADPPRLPR